MIVALPYFINCINKQYTVHKNAMLDNLEYNAMSFVKLKSLVRII